MSTLFYELILTDQNKAQMAFYIILVMHFKTTCLVVYLIGALVIIQLGLNNILGNIDSLVRMKSGNIIKDQGSTCQEDLLCHHA
jgi:hypothetical protein